METQSNYQSSDRFIAPAKRTNHHWFFLLMIVLLFMVIAGVIIFIRLGKPIQNQSKVITQNSTKAYTPTNLNRTVTLPFEVNNPLVQEVMLQYKLVGTVVAFDQAKGQITVKNGTEQQSFTADPRGEVLLGGPNQKANLADIKPGVPVTLIYLKTIHAQTPVDKVISIIINTAATPSASRAR